MLKVANKMQLPMPAWDTAVAVFGFCGLNYIQVPPSVSPEQETIKWAVSIVGGVMFCAFMAGKIWRDLTTSQKEDARSIRSLERRMRQVELDRTALRAMFVALLGKFDIDKTRLAEIGAELERYDDEEPTDDGH